MKVKNFILSYIFFSLLLAPLVLSQPNLAEQTQKLWGDISKILAEYSGIIFVLIFILFILILAGVIKAPRPGRFSFGLILFLIFILLLFILPQFAEFPDYLKTVPIDFQKHYLGPAVSKGFEMIGIPGEWAYLPAVIYYLILPFAAVYTLVWSFLFTLNIFPTKNVNRIIAFLITFLTIPFQMFTKMVWVIFGFLGAWSVAIFAAIFILGLFYRGAGFVAKEKAEYEKYAKATERTYRAIVNQLEGIKKLPSTTDKVAALDKLMTTNGYEIRLVGAENEVAAAKQDPKDENIDRIINKIMEKVKI